MSAIVLALSASLAFGVADFFGGLASRQVRLLTVLVVSQTVGLVGIAAVVAVRGEGPPGTDLLPEVAFGTLFGVAGISFLYRGLAVGLMGVVAPIAATAAVIPVVWGALQGETPTRLQNAGIALALGGVVVVSLGGTVHPGARFAAGAGLGVLAAVSIGSFLVAFDAAAEEDPYWATFTIRTASVFVFLLAALVLRPPLALPGRLALAVPVVGLLDLTGNLLFAIASTKGLVGVVSVLASLYPVATVVLARVFLGERMRAVQGLGVGVCFAGVLLISIG